MRGRTRRRPSPLPCEVQEAEQRPPLPLNLPPYTMCTFVAALHCPKLPQSPIHPPGVLPASLRVACLSAQAWYACDDDRLANLA
jgi:hypothetical protein